jgi:uncharacterized protein YbcI
VAETESTTPSEIARQAIAISNALSRRHRANVGRGPGSVRTVIQKGYVICFLEDIYTTYERTLLDAGKTEAVARARLAYQDAMRVEYIAIVEQITGRRVRAFLSQNHVDPDITAKVFVLEPRADEPSDVDETVLAPAATGTTQTAE